MTDLDVAGAVQCDCSKLRIRQGEQPPKAEQVRPSAAPSSSVQVSSGGVTADSGQRTGTLMPVVPLLVPDEVRKPEGDGPCALRTRLGWYVIGPSHRSARDPVGQHSVNRIGVSRSDIPGKVSEADLFVQLYDQDFKDAADETESLSVEDKEWRLFDEGYAEVVPDAEVETGERVWYLPHHGVRHPEKKKLRVVFDCSAKTDGLCLNDLLIKGPNLTNSLVGVLLRFRLNPVAFTCDVESMFHRVRLPAADANMMRFLWFRNGDVGGDVVVCRMKSHIFGAVSSPSVAGFALRQCAEEGKAEHPEAARIVDQNVYVDDALVSASSVDEAVRLASDLRQLCQTGAFNMRKFTSNSTEFLRSIPREDRGNNAKDLDLQAESLKPERALGMLWSVEDDTFRFRFVDRRRPVTRRGILSTVSALFDPLGIVAPVTLQGKVLVQKLCMMSCGWDDAIPAPLVDEWSEWLAQANRLDAVSLDRCFGAASGEAARQLHVFSDASETGHSAVAFLRTETPTDDGGVVCTVRFVMGKALVNPVKFVTIPRLELAAAVVATRLRDLIVKESGLRFSSSYLWTDSTVVLKYLRNRTARFKTYVANRVTFIRDRTSVEDWKYVPSAANPADVGSRGSTPEDLDMWLKGPDFLSASEESWPCEPGRSVDDSDDLEIRHPSPATVVAAVAEVPQVSAAVSGREQPSATEKLLSHFSSWYRLKKAVAWYIRFFQVLKGRLLSRARVIRDRGLRARGVGLETSLSVDDLRSAELNILRYVQETSFSEFYDRGGTVNVKSSSLKGLNVTLKDGLLVVGAHPVLLLLLLELLLVVVLYPFSGQAEQAVAAARLLAAVLQVPRVLVTMPEAVAARTTVHFAVVHSAVSSETVVEQRYPRMLVG
ncbi:uncharacterized protein LOC122367683 [Amphibalanus amphitrite]|uniref:uncharacterized protein LOC122367683 n=1 Tax=Amphibalanus amphitrite TaxID=1232801 RepID=UPI001C91DDEA|nr:uncharacterized protein LOC122367683 [Amphibalanus amphitrite]